MRVLNKIPLNWHHLRLSFHKKIGSLSGTFFYVRTTDSYFGEIFMLQHMVGAYSRSMDYLPNWCEVSSGKFYVC